MSSVVARSPDGLQPDIPGLLPSALLGEATDGRPPARSTRDWVIDVVAFLISIAFGLTIFFTTPDVESKPDLLLLADLVAGLVFSVALWWRRRWPVHLNLAAVPFVVFSSSIAGASLILLFTLAVHRRARVLLWVALLQTLASIAYGWVRPDPAPYGWWINATLVVAITAAVAAWGMLVRARRQLVVSLRERAQRAEAEQQLRVEQARVLERNRIAREMHDVLAHRISLVSLHAGALEFRVDVSPEEANRAAAVIRESAHKALGDLREILGVLRQEETGPAGEEPPERPQPVPADLPRLVEESRAAGGRVRFANELAVPLEELPDAAGRTVYRVVQEGLTNARKHAPGAEVRVTVSGDRAAGVFVEVVNRWPITGVAGGSGMPGSGQGLAGLGERLLIAGGRLEHGRDAEGDFRLAAWLPWPP